MMISRDSWESVGLVLAILTCLGGVILWVRRLDARRITAMAEGRGWSVRSIRDVPLAFFRGPFAWRFLPRHARIYRVACVDAKGAERTAQVLLLSYRARPEGARGGPEWRWETDRGWDGETDDGADGKAR